MIEEDIDELPHTIVDSDDSEQHQATVGLAASFQEASKQEAESVKSQKHAVKFQQGVPNYGLSIESAIQIDTTPEVSEGGSASDLEDMVINYEPVVKIEKRIPSPLHESFYTPAKKLRTPASSIRYSSPAASTGAEKKVRFAQIPEPSEAPGPVGKSEFFRKAAPIKTKHFSSAKPEVRTPARIARTAFTSDPMYARTQGECDTDKTMSPGVGNPLKGSRGPLQFVRTKEDRFFKASQVITNTPGPSDSPGRGRRSTSSTPKKGNQRSQEEKNNNYKSPVKRTSNNLGNPEDDGSDGDSSYPASSDSEYDSDDESSDSESSEEEDQRDAWRASLPDHHKETLEVLMKISKVSTCS
jgi:hypothetical protein